MQSALSEIADELRSRSVASAENIVQPLPDFKQVDGKWKMDGKVENDKIYEMPFDGSDADAEIIERATSLSFLGDSTSDYPDAMDCIITGKPTKRRVLLSRSY